MTTDITAEERDLIQACRQHDVRTLEYDDERPVEGYIGDPARASTQIGRRVKQLAARGLLKTIGYRDVTADGGSWWTWWPTERATRILLGLPEQAHTPSNLRR